MRKLVMLALCIILAFVSGCDSYKIEKLEDENYELNSEIRSLENEIQQAEIKLEKYKTTYSLSEDETITLSRIIDIVDANPELAQEIHPGDLSNVKTKSQNLKSLHENGVPEVRINPLSKKLFGILIFCVYILVIVVIVVGAVGIIYLCYRGGNLSDKLTRVGAVIAVVLAYLASSAYNISASSLIIALPEVLPTEFVEIAKSVLPLLLGAWFAWHVSKYLLSDTQAERWSVVILTFLLCMFLDVLINTEMPVGDTSVPIANTSFVIGLFTTFFLRENKRLLGNNH